jgi:hypothetical protein
MKKYAGMWLALFTCACGSSNNNASNGNNNGGNSNATINTTINTGVKVQVNGMMKQFPFITSIQDTDIPYATIVLVDPQQILLAPTATPTWLGTAAINPNTCTDAGCPFSIADVDLSALSIGMAAGVIDTRLATNPNAATLYPMFTGVAQLSITAAMAAGNLNDVTAFAVRNDGFALLGNTTTAGAAALALNGALIGLALDANANPLANATLTTTGYTGNKWYPALDGNGNVTQEGTTTMGPTSASGLIIAAPATAVVSLGAGWMLTVPNSGLTWTLPTTLGTAPGFALIVPFPPNP